MITTSQGATAQCLHYNMHNYSMSCIKISKFKLCTRCGWGGEGWRGEGGGGRGGGKKGVGERVGEGVGEGGGGRGWGKGVGEGSGEGMMITTFFTPRCLYYNMQKLKVSIIKISTY